MKTARACLPIPPSSNNMFVNRRGGRTISGDYHRWREAAGWTLKALRLPKIAGKVAIEIELPAKMRGDIDNRIKPLCDLLVTHGLIDDDRHVWKITVERVEMLIEEARVTYSTAVRAG